MKLRRTPTESRIPNDEDLLAQILDGSQRQQTSVYNHILPVCRATLVRVLGPADFEFEDLLQSSLEQVVTTVLRGKFSRGCSLRTWTMAVTRNVAFAALRKRKRERQHFAHELHDIDTFADDSTAAHLERVTCGIEHARIRATVRELPTDIALPLLMHDLLGYDSGEIGRRLGLSRAGVQSRIRRSRLRARRKLELAMKRT